MKHPITSLVIVLLTATLGFSDDKPDVAALKKKIAQAEATLAELRVKLAEAEGEPKEFKDVEKLEPGKMVVGTSGWLVNGSGYVVSQKVLEIIDDDTILASISRADSTVGRVIIKGYPTKGLVDGSIIEAGKDLPHSWNVVGTEKYGRSTLFVLRLPPKKK